MRRPTGPTAARSTRAA